METGVPFPVSGHSSALARISWAEEKTQTFVFLAVDMMSMEAVVFNEPVRARVDEGNLLVYAGWVGTTLVSGFLSGGVCCCCCCVVVGLLLFFCCPGNTLFAGEVVVLVWGSSCCNRCQARICTSRSSSLLSSTSTRKQFALNLSRTIRQRTGYKFTLHCVRV